MKPVINFGYVPLAGAFIKGSELNAKKQFKNEKFYPLELSFCLRCYLLQVNNVIDRDILFQDYSYRSSTIKTLVSHFENTAIDLKKNLLGDAFIVEIGSNDGVFINALLQNGFKALGVDPAINVVAPLIAKGLPIINDYFSEKLGKEIYKQYGKADAIFSFNTFAHIEDMHDVINGVKVLLKPTGFLAFEVHYLGNLVKDIQYDMIYHEHQYYYSLLALRNFFTIHALEIFDAVPSSIHAGSMRFYVQHKQARKRKLSNTIKKLMQQEKKMELHKAKTYIAFSSRIKKSKERLLRTLNRIKREGKTVVGYGASGRSTTIMNYCGLDSTYLEYIIDDSPSRQNVLTPGTHIKTTSSSVLLGKRKPDYILLFAWSFKNEIMQKNSHYIHNGGKFIIPLPKPRIISKED